MLKIIGFLIIMVSATKIGFDYSSKYIARTRELKAIIFILEKLKSEIKFSNNTIPQALEIISHTSVLTVKNMFLSVCSMVENECCSLDFAFKTYIIDNNTLSLSKEDLEVIQNFFSMLGTGDVEDEIKNINSTSQKLNMLLQDSLESEAKYVKLYRTCGVLAGCLISIMLV